MRIYIYQSIRQGQNAYITNTMQLLNQAWIGLSADLWIYILAPYKGDTANIFIHSLEDKAITWTDLVNQQCKPGLFVNYSSLYVLRVSQNLSGSDSYSVSSYNYLSRVYNIAWHKTSLSCSVETPYLSISHTSYLAFCSIPIYLFINSQINN